LYNARFVFPWTHNWHKDYITFFCLWYLVPDHEEKLDFLFWETINPPSMERPPIVEGIVSNLPWILQQLHIPDLDELKAIASSVNDESLDIKGGY